MCFSSGMVLSNNYKPLAEILCQMQWPNSQIMPNGTLSLIQMKLNVHHRICSTSFVTVSGSIYCKRLTLSDSNSNLFK
uniref:Uncharacterized protein n=1 Tax=Anguilla anguilla TaxID=7936 RepID=A0A0E9WEZ7_ANGAN